ncbi:hypothetical protein [Rathayibacter oskolensis]|uniref:hypothetical protein n=1 Tax=Rathayibacter oskolensis TaxID=1891671 RepID=UPI00101AD861|nr:hypothetical protein [Rathayibacter oskolensis]
MANQRRIEWSELSILNVGKPILIGRGNSFRAEVVRYIEWNDEGITVRLESGATVKSDDSFGVPALWVLED